MISENPLITRFAPSPTGYLHLGHAYAAWFAEQIAKEADGTFLLRIEDIDHLRCRFEYENAILEDLSWLGLKWQQPVRRQSDHMKEYVLGIEKLKNMGLIYPCFCSRKQIREEIQNINAAPHDQLIRKQGPIYPGTCRMMKSEDCKERIASGHSYALRLNMEKAMHLAIQKKKKLCWIDKDTGLQTATPEHFGDVVLARKDDLTSYHLSVVIDDAVQGVNLITRGEDLRDVTHIHCLLQALLDYESPVYNFHRMLVDDRGRRLAKRNKSLTLRKLREDGLTVEEIKEMTNIL